MTASLKFYAGENFNIQHLSGSGLGFYGSNGFGYSVSIGSYQDTTFITDSTGSDEGPQVDNTKYVNTSGVSVNGGGNIHIQELPNYLATLNARFTNAQSVKTQNAKIYGSERGDKNAAPSGLTLKAASVIHPNTTQDLSGSGSANWVTLQGSGVTLSLHDSPGTSGLSPNGSETQDTRHDFYIALSSKPNTAGAKEFQIQVELEYV